MHLSAEVIVVGVARERLLAGDDAALRSRQQQPQQQRGFVCDSAVSYDPRRMSYIGEWWRVATIDRAGKGDVMRKQSHGDGDFRFGDNFVKPA